MNLIEYLSVIMFAQPFKINYDTVLREISLQGICEPRGNMLKFKDDEKGCYMNRVKQKPRVDTSTLMVNEIFYSIQGESSHAGKPCVFIRLTYCNLRCTYCDTPYAFYEGKPFTISEILEYVKQHRCELVEVTGGEPLIQPGANPLMAELCNAGYTVMLETSGSISIAEVDPRVIKIVDFKCPSSGMVHKNREENVHFLFPQDEVKFVIGNREDYQWALDFIKRTGVAKKVHAVLFSPVFNTIEPREMVEWMLADHLQEWIPNIRFQLQLHKFIWSPHQRGV